MDDKDKNLVKCVDHFIEKYNAKVSYTELKTARKMRIDGKDISQKDAKNRLFLFADSHGYTDDHNYPGFSNDLVKQFLSIAPKVIRE